MSRYVEMSEPAYEIVSKRIRESYPNSCICWIEENTNADLLVAYENRKQQISTRGNINEVQFFHGTKEDIISKIAMEGFDPAFNRVSAYGKGTYFAKNASYSLNYMKPNKEDISFMFLCDVLLGNSCKGSLNLTIDVTTHDSAVDNTANPTIAVTPYADGAYPRYIIAFHKGAI